MRTRLVCASLVCALLVSSSAFGGSIEVGSPVIDRPINDSSSGVIYLYLGGSQPFGGPGSITQWSFFDNETSNANSKVTPLLYELTATNQWTVVAIGTTRVSNSSGVQTYPFGTLAGNSSFQAGHLYTIGFTHRGYTGSGSSLVPDGGNTGVVDYSGYNDYSDRWAYAIGTVVLGTKLGTGGFALDSLGLGGRIYSVKFTVDGSASNPVTYCTAGTSSHGCVPSISSTGSPSAGSSSGFTIHVANVEGAKQGLIFYGVSGRMNSPWGSGGSSFLCVKAPTQRMSLLSSGGTSNQCNGAFNADWLAFLATSSSALGEPFSAGDTVDAQAWYRDPPAVKTTNLSNALEFTTVP